ncbi:hypothetical protein ACQEV2_33505 [Streptomyces sp. CA-251387]|uniref:hypothetical protein n=1 Tax=Streptomyces sp. CA-251387 TaxID=3240064 RepID=UPI003D8DEEF4
MIHLGGRGPARPLSLEPFTGSVRAGVPRRGGADAVRPTAVPYYAWANRRPGPMRVWIAQV